MRDEAPGALAAPSDWPASPEPAASLEGPALLDEPVPPPPLDEPGAPPSSVSTPPSSGLRLASPTSLPGAAPSDDPASALADLRNLRVHGARVVETQKRNDVCGPASSLASVLCGRALLHRERVEQGGAAGVLPHFARVHVCPLKVSMVVDDGVHAQAEDIRSTP